MHLDGCLSSHTLSANFTALDSHPGVRDKEQRRGNLTTVRIVTACDTLREGLKNRKLQLKKEPFQQPAALQFATFTTKTLELPRQARSRQTSASDLHEVGFGGFFTRTESRNIKGPVSIARKLEGSRYSDPNKRTRCGRSAVALFMQLTFGSFESREATADCLLLMQQSALVAARGPQTKAVIGRSEI